jgi:hypothetical protein
MSRREQLARAVRLKQQKQKAPVIIVLPDWSGTNDPPLVIWGLNHRKPTEQELVAALIAAGYSRERAEAGAVRSLNKEAYEQSTKSHPKPGSISQPADPEEE